MWPGTASNRRAGCVLAGALVAGALVAGGLAAVDVQDLAGNVGR